MRDLGLLLFVALEASALVSVSPLIQEAETLSPLGTMNLEGCMFSKAFGDHTTVIVNKDVSLCTR